MFRLISMVRLSFSHTLHHLIAHIASFKCMITLSLSTVIKIVNLFCLCGAWSKTYQNWCWESSSTEPNLDDALIPLEVALIAWMHLFQWWLLHSWKSLFHSWKGLSYSVFVTCGSCCAPLSLIVTRSSNCLCCKVFLICGTERKKPLWTMCSECGSCLYLWSVMSG